MLCISTEKILGSLTPGPIFQSVLALSTQAALHPGSGSGLSFCRCRGRRQKHHTSTCLYQTPRKLEVIKTFVLQSPLKAQVLPWGQFTSYKVTTVILWPMTHRHDSNQVHLYASLLFTWALSHCSRRQTSKKTKSKQGFMGQRCLLHFVQNVETLASTYGHQPLFRAVPEKFHTHWMAAVFLSRESGLANQPAFWNGWCTWHKKFRVCSI